jgi:hypothetical protein
VTWEASEQRAVAVRRHLAAVREADSRADFSELLHPRNRLGRWRIKLGGVAKKAEVVLDKALGPPVDMQRGRPVAARDLGIDATEYLAALAPILKGKKITVLSSRSPPTLNRRGWPSREESAAAAQGRVERHPLLRVPGHRVPSRTGPGDIIRPETITVKSYGMDRSHRFFEPHFRVETMGVDRRGRGVHFPEAMHVHPDADVHGLARGERERVKAKGLDVYQRIHHVRGRGRGESEVVYEEGTRPYTIAAASRKKR